MVIIAAGNILTSGMYSKVAGEDKADRGLLLHQSFLFYIFVGISAVTYGCDRSLGARIVHFYVISLPTFIMFVM